jgi:hypothetical protein
MGAGLPSIATVTPPRVVGNTFVIIAVSHVTAAPAKFVPDIVTHDPDSAPAMPLAEFLTVLICGRPVVEIDAGVKT